MRGRSPEREAGREISVALRAELLGKGLWARRSGGLLGVLAVLRAGLLGKGLWAAGVVVCLEFWPF